MTEEKPWESSSLIERLKWWAFKFCGKGYHETMASDVMTEAHERITQLEDALKEILSLGDWGANPLARTIAMEALGTTYEQLDGKEGA